MKQTTELLIVAIAKKCARVSLLMGLAIFLTFATTTAAPLSIIGFIFLIVTFMANGVILFILLMYLAISKINREQIFYAIIIMLANIPIAIFFAWLSIQIADLKHLNL